MSTLKFISLVTILTIILVSCGSSKHNNCDAYGNKSGDINEADFDIHHSHTNSATKYVTTTSIK